jgi:hypothetical protein
MFSVIQLLQLSFFFFCGTSVVWEEGVQAHLSEKGAAAKLVAKLLVRS